MTEASSSFGTLLCSSPCQNFGHGHASVFAPAISAMLSMAAMVLRATMVLWASTNFAMCQDCILGSPVARACLCPIGPRPSAVIPQDKWLQLILFLVIGIIGCASHLLPLGCENCQIWCGHPFKLPSSWPCMTQCVQN